MTTAAGGPSIVLDGVSKSFLVPGGTPLYAARDVDLTIDPGSSVALTGESGSGKSTLLHLVGAMDKVSSGTITVDGVDIGQLRGRQLARYRRSVGFVFQRFHLLPALTVRDNVLAPLLPVRGNRSLRGRADTLIAAVGLEDRERALPSQLSGGQQQRVAIARALVTEPSLLLADEPTGNLDSATGDDILTLLFRLQESSGNTLLIATHDLQAATRCQRLLHLRDGRVIDDTHLSSDAEHLVEDVNQLRL